MSIENLDFKTGKRVSIELGTQLQIRIEGVDYNLSSTLIGMEPDNYLIIKAPGSMLAVAKQKLFRRCKIIVRYLYKGSVFGFKSELIEDIYNPLKLLFVEYPEIIEEHNLRSGERVNCVLPIKIEISNTVSSGVILDICREGCCCVIRKADQDKEIASIQIDQQIALICQFPQIDGEHKVSGKVRSIRRDKKQITLGIIFDGIGPKIEDIIAQYIITIK